MSTLTPTTRTILAATSTAMAFRRAPAVLAACERVLRPGASHSPLLRARILRIRDRERARLTTFAALRGS